MVSLKRNRKKNHTILKRNIDDAVCLKITLFNWFLGYGCIASYVDCNPPPPQIPYHRYPILLTRPSDLGYFPRRVTTLDETRDPGGTREQGTKSLGLLDSGSFLAQLPRFDHELFIGRKRMHEHVHTPSVDLSDWSMIRSYVNTPSVDLAD